MLRKIKLTVSFILSWPIMFVAGIWYIWKPQKTVEARFNFVRPRKDYGQDINLQ